ncbi:MAG: peptide-methionine (R)-S-oxide reductase MsrB [Candidatus Thorarchaeota archaeon]|nr:MAG: peptide-methionine (R)-S-oxide reductase MsrB [Candidatus Thorarchaeota archaeon]
MNKTKDEWKLTLSKDQYNVLRECGTEPPFTGKYVNHKENGVYVCAGCGNELFSSDTKFESGSGWPSFWDQVSEDSIERREDNSLWMKRIEIVCKKCGGHLGHVFDDGPNPTGLRYCVNSLSLKFKSTDEE